MAVITGRFSELTLALGLIGNIFSVFVVLSSVFTFYEVYKKKSTQGLQWLPYMVGLFSATLWVYYALVKGDSVLVITIRSAGILIQILYICGFICYIPTRAEKRRLKLTMLFMVTGFGLIVLLSQLLTKAGRRIVMVGWVFLILSSFFVVVAPLGILMQVVKSKSAKYMPMLPVLFSTFNAMIWFFYGLLLGNFNIMIPNILGFTLSVIQIIYYFVYKEDLVIAHNITENIDQMSEMNIDPKDKTEIQKVPNLDGHLADVLSVSIDVTD